MIPWELLDTAEAPDGRGELKLYRRGADYAIRVGHLDLMHSRTHGSEEVLAQSACRPIAERPTPCVLVGGLGMGYTLAAALAELGPTATVEVAELVPAVIAWNRGPLAHLAGHPLDDPRVVVREGDIATLIRRSTNAYDAIMNDVDNGPDGLLLDGNAWLYSEAGLRTTWAALRPGGVLTVWSVGPDRHFTPRLRKIGFAAREVTLRDRAGTRGRRHTIWMAQKTR